MEETCGLLTPTPVYAAVVSKGSSDSLDALHILVVIAALAAQCSGTVARYYFEEDWAYAALQHSGHPLVESFNDNPY